MLAEITGPLSERAAAKTGLLYGSTFADIPSEIEFHDGDRSVGITGALGAASGIVEIFLLEYCQWPEKKAGWGAADAMILRDILPIHSRIFDAVNRAPSVARTRAGELTMLLASSLLSEELCLAKVPDAVKEPAAAAKAAIFVGHDTNIAGVGALIGADWQLPGFAKNEVPPGGALVLSLWQRGKERYVTAEFTGLSLEALHGDADQFYMSPGAAWTKYARFVHSGRMNVLFADGHAGSHAGSVFCSGGSDVRPDSGTSTGWDIVHWRPDGKTYADGRPKSM